MQDPSKGRTELERASTDTALGRCLVDGDAATNSHDRRRRRKALGISLAIEAVALTLLVVAPLMTSVAQPHYAGTEIVRFVFGGSPTHTPAGHPPSGNHHPPTLGDHRIKFTTDQAPPRPAQLTEEPDDATNSNPYTSIDSSNGSGPLISDLRPTGAVAPPPSEIEKPEDRRALKVSGPVQQAQLTSRVEPRYPVIAIQTRTEGTVLLHAIISRDGRITALEVVSGPPLLVKAALDAVRQWRYRPTYLGGEPVEVDTSITVIFRLNR
jgi:periplasmic protein TonB